MSDNLIASPALDDRRPASIAFVSHAMLHAIEQVGLRMVDIATRQNVKILMLTARIEALEAEARKNGPTA